MYQHISLLEGNNRKKEKIYINTKTNFSLRLILLIMSSFLLHLIFNPNVIYAADPTFLKTVIDSGASGDVKALGDINGDGFADIVIGGAEMSWYEYPTWTKHTVAVPVAEFTTDMQLADIDNDGDLDIVTADNIFGSNVIWLENPRPSLSPTSPWTKHVIGSRGNWAHDIEVADLDDDGKLDVIARKNETLIFFQNTPDSWTMRDISSALGGDEGLGIGDVDNDGDVDLAGNGRWVENPVNPRTDAWIGRTIASGFPIDTTAVVGDLNSDGRSDIVFIGQHTRGKMAWYEGPVNPIAGPWVEHIVDGSMGSHKLNLGDLNRDGKLDIVAGLELAELAVYTQETNGIFTKDILSTTGLHNQILGDVGNDGDLDIVGANWIGHPPLELWENTTPTQLTLDDWTPLTISSTHTLTFSLGFGDVNSDGKKDIVSGNYWYSNPGGNLATGWNQSAFPNSVHAFAVIDVDSDALTDVIAQKMEGANLSLYWLEATTMTGANWNSTLIGSVPGASHPEGAQGYRVADIRAGGKPEILISSGDGVWYFEIPANPSLGNWTKVKVNSNPSDEGFGVSDIDRDGFLDVAAGTGNSRRVEWYKNPGNGVANWTAFVIGDMSDTVFPDRFDIADLNGDGRADIVGTEENGIATGARTFWWEQPTNATSTNWTRRTVVTQGTTNSMDVADMDLDGDKDLVLAEHRGGLKMAVWENGGTGNFIEHVAGTGRESHLGARAVDLDNDGDNELVSIAYDNSQFMYLWRNDANTVSLPPDTTAPVISNVASSNIFSANATISWTTNEPATSKVEYGLTSGYGLSTATSSSLILSHSTLLSGLSASTTYHYRVISADSTGNTSISPDFIFTTTSFTPPPSGLMTYLKLDETSGNVAFDSSNNGNTGTLQNNPAWTSGQVLGALDFNGTNQYINLPNMDISGTGITLSTWIKFDSFPSNSDARFISKATNATEDGHYWMLGQTNNGNNRLRFRLKTGSVTTTLIASSGNLSANTWYHAAATYNGSTMKLFLNGVEVGSVSKTGTVATSASVPVNLARNPDGSNYADAKLDEVRIYNRGLSSSEIIEVMNDTGTPPPPDTQAPTVSITSPANGATVAGTVNVTANVTDNIGVDRVEFSVDGTAHSTDTTSSYSASINTTLLSEGSHVVMARAFDVVGNNATSSVSIIVQNTDTASPSVPTNISAIAVSTSQINLAWNASTDNVGVAGYKVFRGGSHIATTTALSYQNTGLSPSTTYIYSISAFDATGNNSAQSAEVSTTTQSLPPPDTTAPVISAVASSAITTSSATISWNTNEASDTQVDYGPTLAYGSSTPLNSILETSHAQSISGLVENTLYHYRVKSRDAVLNLATSSDFTFTTSSAPTSTPNLMAHWKLDETSGTVASDSSGNGRTGTLTNGPVWTTAGQIAGALTLDGNNDYVSVPTFDITGSAMTMTAWVRFTSLPTNVDQRFLSKANDSSEAGHYWMFGQTYTGSAHRLRFRLRTGSTTSTLIASSGNLAVNTWYHATAVYNGSTMKLFLNGVEVGSVNKTGSISTSAAVPVNIARNPGGSGNNFIGTMDDMRVYDKALTPAEITALMNP